MLHEACPICRHPWEETSNNFMTMANANGIPLQTAITIDSDDDDEQVLQVDLTPPVLVWCCPRVYMVDGQFVDADNDRCMQYYPNVNNGDSWSGRKQGRRKG